MVEVPPPEPEDEAERLATLRAYEILDTEPEEEFDELAWLASQVCQTPIALVSLVDEDRQWFKARVGLEAFETPRRISFCGHAILGSDTLVVPNALEDPRFCGNPLVENDPRIRFYAGAPLRAPDGQKLGTLCVIDRVPRQLSESQLEGLERLSRQVMHQFELRQLLRSQIEINTRRRELLEGLQEVDRLRHEYVANVSHELRTPLTAIYGTLRILSREPALPERLRELVRSAEGSAQRLTRLTNDLVDLERSSAGRLELTLEVVEPRRLLEEVAQALSGLADRAGVTLVVEVAEGVPQVRVDVDRIAQVLTNLVGNAIRHSPPGTGITLGCRRREGYARFEVADRGEGIREDVRRQLFGRFQRMGSSKGAGLGLSISKALVESHGGKIECLENPGGGSVFAFDLPALER